MRSATFGFVLLALTACDGEKTTPATTSPSPSAKASAKPSAASSAIDPHGPPVGIPVPQADIAKAVNPAGEAPYSGPAGTLTGRVTLEGDPPPDRGLSFPPKCGEAAATYGKLFRVGQDKGVADVLVAVTPEHGFVPASGPSKSYTIHGCALSTRTVVVTFGQRIEVANQDASDMQYMPYLLGQKSAAVLVAVPGGDAVKLYPTDPKAHYLLKDELPHPFLVADVFVLAYSTFAVTGLDGKFEVKGIPVGKAQINAYLPSIDKTVTKDVEIKEGANPLDIAFPFDLKKDVPGATPSSSASASAAPKPPKK